MLKKLFGYPKFHVADEAYEEYWQNRKIRPGTFNSFQKKRAELSLEYVEPSSVLLDVGTGNGALLAYLNKHKPMQRLIGVDFSSTVLDMARLNGIETIQADISQIEVLEQLPAADYIFFFEVLEHLANS